MESGEFHDLSEMALNSAGHSWGNLGYWTEGETDYSQACRSLAINLGKIADLDRQSVVFDAGFGCGDQLCLWLDHFHVSDICGINISKSQTERARLLLDKNGYSPKTTSIITGDIGDFDQWPEVIGARNITHFVALDCAYHFTNRSGFFCQAQSHLSPAGTLVLTDFLLMPTENTALIHRIILALMFRLSRIPQSNMIEEMAYSQKLKASGFSQISIQDISRPVMYGFHKGMTFQKTERLPLTLRFKYGLTARFLNWAYKRAVLRYVMIKAVKSK